VLMKRRTVTNHRVLLKFWQNLHKLELVATSRSEIKKINDSLKVNSIHIRNYWKPTIMDLDVIDQVLINVMYLPVTRENVSTIEQIITYLHI
jgi:hypothetical protein